MTVKQKLGISIVGCGTISEIHAAAIQQSFNARLISVYSRNPQNARRVGEKFNVPWETDWGTFMKNDTIDIVSVCTPSGNHLDYGKKAAQASKHVIVEKPNQKQFEAIVDAIKKNTVPPLPGEEALKSLALVLAIYESSNLGKPIILKDFIAEKMDLDDKNNN